MADFERAVLHIERHGTPLDKALMACVLDEMPARGEDIQGVLENGNIAGDRTGHEAAHAEGIGMWPLEAVCCRLDHAFHLGANRSQPAVLQALDGIARRQTADGWWSEHDLSPHHAQTDVTVLCLTAHCGYLLALYGHQPGCVEKSVKALLARMGPDGVFSSTLRTHWLCAGVLAMADEGGRDGGRLDVLLDYLFTRLDDMDAKGLVGMLNSLLDAGIAGEHRLLGAAADRLAMMQDAQGGWPTPAAIDVRTTVLALRAMIRMERFDSHPFFN